MFCSTAIACVADWTFNCGWLKGGFVLDDGDKRFSADVNISYVDSTFQEKMSNISNVTSDT